MIKAFRNIQKQLVLSSRARFCQTPNKTKGKDLDDVLYNDAAEVARVELIRDVIQGETSQLAKGSGSNSKKKQYNAGEHQSGKEKEYQHLQGSKISAGTSDEIRISIQKSAEQFASQYKLSLGEKTLNPGNQSTFVKNENVKPISERAQDLLNQLKPTDEVLNSKGIGNVPIAQQIMVDRLKKYGLRNSDSRRIKAQLQNEEGVDFCYVEPRNLEILNSHIHRQSEEMETFVSTYLGVNETLSKAEKLDEWRQQQALSHVDKSNLIHNFAKYTPDTMGKPETFYPGSPKGPHPLDDPHFYVQWYDKNCPKPYKPIVDQMVQIAEMKITDSYMPSFIKKWIQDVQEDPQEEEKNKDEQEEDKDSASDQDGSEDEDELADDSNAGRAYTEELETQLTSVVGGGLGVFFYRSGTLPRLNADNSSLWHLDQNDALSEEISPEEQIINSEGNMTFHSGLQEFEIPPFPEKMDTQVTHYMIPIVDKWSVFRQYPNMYHWWKNLYEFTMTLSEQPLTRYQFSGLPSVYTYFHTLPEYARNNIIVQNVARCFEFRRHEITHTQKMMALNLAAKFTLPIDDLIYHAASQMIISQKHFLTAKEEDRLKTVNVFYYEADPDAFALHLAHEEHTIEQIESYQPPKYLQPEEVEEQLCDLPLEYYDNEDGFWDEHIKEKNNRNNRAYPTIQGRPFFKH